MVVRLTEMAKVLVTCDQNTLSTLVVGRKEMANVFVTCDQKYTTSILVVRLTEMAKSIGHL